MASRFALTHDCLEHFAVWVEKRSYWAIGICTLVFFVCSLAIAQRKLLWDDEFFTLYISGASSSQEIWRALLTGADQHPPSFYFLTRAFFSVFGMSSVIVRLPAMLGFWLMMLCLYAIVSRRTSPLYGLAAMLFPLLTVGYYASEARGYGLVLGFGSLALLCWMAAADGRRRWLTIPGLWLALAAAVGSHYYAILLLAPLGIGEFVRLLKNRRFDFAVAAAFTGAVVPLLLFYPIIQRAQEYSAHFWAKPAWIQPLAYFPNVMTGAFWPLFIGLLVWSLKLSGKPTGANRHSLHLPAHEMAALLTFLTIPFVAVTMGKLVTNAFATRYVVSTLIGCAVLFAYVTFWAMGGARRAALFFCGLSLAWISLSLWLGFLSYERVEDDLRKTAQFLRSNVEETKPIALPDVITFHRLSYYAPRSLAKRLIFVADPDQSVRYVSMDTVDRGLLALRPWFPLRVEEYGSVVRSYPRFASFSEVGRWAWLSFALARDRQLEAKLVGRLTDRILLDVTSSPAVDQTDGSLPKTDPWYETPEGMPINETDALCSRWTRDRACSVMTELLRENAHP